MKALEKDGWYLVRTRGSHRVLKHHVKPGIVVLPGHPADDLAPGTLRSVREQAKLEGKL